MEEVCHGRASSPMVEGSLPFLPNKFAILLENMRRRDLTEAPFESRLESDSARSPRPRTVLTRRSVILIDGSSITELEGSYGAGGNSSRSSMGSAKDVRFEPLEERRESREAREVREARELREWCEAADASSSEPRRDSLSPSCEDARWSTLSCEGPRRREASCEDPRRKGAPSVCESRRDSCARRSSGDWWCLALGEWPERGTCESSCAEPRRELAELRRELTELRREPRMPAVCWKKVRRAGPELERGFFSGARFPENGVDIVEEETRLPTLSALCSRTGPGSGLPPIAYKHLTACFADSS